MSTFEPGLEPPSDWRHQPPAPTPGSTPGSTPGPTPGPTPTTTGAASMVWLCSAMGVLFSTCCVCFGLFAMIMPQDKMMRHLPPDLPDRGQVVEMIPMLPTIGVVIAILGVVFMLIPAIVLAVLGFKVKQGNRGGTIAAMVALGILGMVLGMILLMSLRGLVTMTPSIANFGLVIVMAGSVLIIAGTMVSLYKALNEQRTGPGSPNRVEPWSL